VITVASSLGQRQVHSIVDRYVLAQLPGASQEIHAGVAVQVEIHEVGDGVGSTSRGDLAGANEPPKSLGHFDVHQVQRVKLVPIPKETGLDLLAKRRLQEKPLRSILGDMGDYAGT
jgi:hypothetical protein